jgi:GxxExxY protein
MNTVQCTMRPMKPDDLNGISERVIGCAFDVSNALEVGFLEKVYENALAHELRKSGPVVAQQHPVTVIYDRVVLGNYAVDLLVEESVMAETSGLGRIRDALEAAQGAFFIAFEAVSFRLGKPHPKSLTVEAGPPGHSNVIASWPPAGGGPPALDETTEGSAQRSLFRPDDRRTSR